jgi:hypothetical protein
MPGGVGGEEPRGSPLSRSSPRKAHSGLRRGTRCSGRKSLFGNKMEFGNLPLLTHQNPPEGAPTAPFVTDRARWAGSEAGIRPVLMSVIGPRTLSPRSVGADQLGRRRDLTRTLGGIAFAADGAIL